MKRDDLPRLVIAFPEEEFYCPPTEIIQLEMGREQRGHFNLIHHDTGFKADIYLCGSDPLHRWGLANIKSVHIEDDHVNLAPPEYVIIRKLQFFKEGGSQKHLRDISRMLLAMGNQFDRESLDQMIREHGLSPEWQQVLAELD